MNVKDPIEIRENSKMLMPGVERSRPEVLKITRLLKMPVPKEKAMEIMRCLKCFGTRR